MDATLLIEQLTATVQGQIERSREVATFPSERLIRRPMSDQWNALEIFQHLCLSSGIYVRGLEKTFDENADRYPFNGNFKPGLLGEYFTKGMLPGPDGRIRNRMRTLRMFDPPRNGGASLESIQRFMDLCERSLKLLERARTTDLNRMRVISSLGPVIRFKAGDALRFPIAHQQRHFLQLERALASVDAAR